MSESMTVQKWSAQLSLLTPIASWGSPVIAEGDRQFRTF